MAHAPNIPTPNANPGYSKIESNGSGKVGVGKTTDAVNLAIALSRIGQRVGLIDADIYGPNVPLMMGSSQQPAVGPGNIIIPNLTLGIKTISTGYISPGDKPMVMRGPMLHQIIRQFLQQVEWGELDYLIVDLPPGTGDVVISLVQTVPLTGAVVVSTPSDVSLQDARKALEMFAQVNVEVLGIVENMSHFTCPHCHQEIDIFSKGGAERTAKQYNLPSPRLRRAHSLHPRGRRPRPSRHARRTQEPTGHSLLRHRGKTNGPGRVRRLLRLRRHRNQLGGGLRPKQKGPRMPIHHFTFTEQIGGLHRQRSSILSWRHAELRALAA